MLEIKRYRKTRQECENIISFDDISNLYIQSLFFKYILSQQDTTFLRAIGKQIISITGRSLRS